MAALETTESLLVVVRKSGLVKNNKLDAHLEKAPPPADPAAAAEELVKADLLTPFQAKHLLQGKHKGLILGPYKVLKPIAKGGMGLVYLAEHIELRRRVALKVCMTDRVGKGAVERFQREGRALAAVDHPNIVRVHDVGKEGNTHFLVMEYVEGRSLEDLLQEKGRIPYREAVGFVLQAAKGLQHAHERGLVHRDVKPANLIIDQNGTVRLLDMGLARFFADNEDNLTERLGGRAILGSPDYMSPEQALNRLDIRSDIYSLGATLHALVSGRPPFPEKTAPQKLISHQVRSPPPLSRIVSTIPIQLTSIVLKMLAKDPAQRFQTPAEVIEALTPWSLASEQGPKNGVAAAMPAAIAPSAVLAASVSTEAPAEQTQAAVKRRRTEAETPNVAVPAFAAIPEPIRPRSSFGSRSPRLEPPPIEQEVVEQVAETCMEDEKKRSRGGKGLLVRVGAAAVVLVGLCAAWWMGCFSAGKKPDAS